MNSPISRIGGKKLLRDEIIKRFPANIDRYIEVFGGAGWVLFRKDKHAALEVYNDADGALVNLFRCMKYHAKELQRQMDFVLTSREVLENYRNMNGMPGFTDIQRAAQFFTLVKISFGTDLRSFICNKKNVPAAVEKLKDVQKRLESVVIERKDFENLIKVYDAPGALFYCDPPYHGTEKYYDHGFTEKDHQRLHDCLCKIKGRFVLSYNDDEYIRNLYKDFNIEEVTRNHNLKSGERYRELIIKNF